MPYDARADHRAELVAETPDSGGGAVPLAQVEGEPSGSGKPGVVLLAKWRPFGAGVDVDEDGDWTALQTDADGGLYVKILGTVQTATSSTTGGRPLIYYYGSSAEFLFPVFDDTEYQWAATANGAGQVCLFDSDGVEAGTSDNPVRVDPTGTTVQPVIGGPSTTATIRANYTAAQTNAAIITVSSGTRIVVTRVMVTADKANTVDVGVVIGFGASSTPTTDGVLAAHPGIDPGGGFVVGNGGGILGIGGDGDDVRITSEVPTSGSIDVTLTYYTEAV